MVSAVYGVGFAPMLQCAAYGIPDVVTRQLSMGTPLITTYLLRRAGDSLPETLSAFIDRAIRELGEDGYGGSTHAVASPDRWRSEEHTSELQSLMRISSADFCLKKKIHLHLTTTNAYI